LDAPELKNTKNVRDMEFSQWHWEF